ncbi:MAG: YlmH/Sll1252 family protein [Lachnospiraceae bacterium]|nr:YlmH/Sll1252 family protein [Lachnospiraceae bacterium]
MEKSEELFQKRLMDLADSAMKRGIVTFTDFMNLNELNIFHSMIQKFSYIQWKTFGGYEAAERQTAAFIPDALYYEWDFPIACLEISPLNIKFADALTHRDYLGALLNLGIERDMLGDILVDDKRAYVFVIDRMQDFISKELTRVRHTPVVCRERKLQEFDVPIKTEVIAGSVASVRLDSILALAFHSSRSSLVGLIEGGKIFVNGKLVVSNGYTLKEGDIVSARGLGKFRYKQAVYRTKKGRCMVEIEKYV